MSKQPVTKWREFNISDELKQSIHHQWGKHLLKHSRYHQAEENFKNATQFEVK